MGPLIAATVFGLAALVAAFFFRPTFVANKSIMRVCIFWALVTPILFLLPQMLAALIICGVLLAILAPGDLEERAAFYIMTLFAIPVSINANIPFPGINYIINLDFAKVAAFVLLIPAIVFSPKPNVVRYAAAPGIFILLLTFLYSVQEFRTENITNGLRGVVGDVLQYAIPFMALVRLLSARDRFDKVFSSFLMIAVIFFFAAFISQLTNWNYYSYLQERFGIPVMADFRGGILRVSVTVIPILVGFVAALGLIAAEYFRAERKCGFLMAWIYRGMFLVTALFTFSRGAWLAMIVGVGAYYFFTKFPRGVRPPLVFLGLAAGLPLAVAYVMQADLSQFDQYGTFEYRRELLRSAFVQISQHPIFGDPNFLESGNFDENVQGEGIVDVVNYYLQIALAHGLLGLAFFIGAYVAAAFGLLSLGKIIKAADDKTLERQRAVMIAFLASYLAMIATVSAVSLISHVGVVIVAMAAAFVAATRKDAAEQRAEQRLTENASGEWGETPREASGARTSADTMGDLYG